jgi:hypothetical protein
MPGSHSTALRGKRSHKRRAPSDLRPPTSHFSTFYFRLFTCQLASAFRNPHSDFQRLMISVFSLFLSHFAIRVSPLVFYFLPSNLALRPRLSAFQHLEASKNQPQSARSVDGRSGEKATSARHFPLVTRHFSSPSAFRISHSLSHIPTFHFFPSFQRLSSSAFRISKKYSCFPRSIKTHPHCAQ